jgi:lipopolysaccharide/colanic/teichoic acid biosynthesis glycosyltransferase
MMLALVAMVRLTSGGKAIYRQARVGEGGNTFTMYKIRTMVSNAEARSGAVWTQPGDPRVTAVGRVLRRLHLDELPQLFNVLKGEMSLIGPRPERPEFVEILAKDIEGYRNRLLVRPGITGLAQINLPPDTDLESVRRKLVLDLEYVEKANLLLDARMFLCTLVRLCGMPGAWAMSLFRLQREVSTGTEPLHQPITIHQRTAPAHRSIAHSGGNGKPSSNGHAASDGTSPRVSRKPR